MSSAPFMPGSPSGSMWMWKAPLDLGLGREEVMPALLVQLGQRPARPR
jgi:hypothetical protein